MELLGLSTTDLDEDYPCGQAPQMFTGCGISPDGVKALRHDLGTSHLDWMKSGFFWAKPHSRYCFGT